MTEDQMDNLWKTVKGELEIVANPAYFKTHIPGTYIKNVDEENKIIEITSPSEFQRNFIEDRLYGHIKKIFIKTLGPDYRLIFTVTKREPTQLSAKDLGPLFNQSDTTNPDNMLDRVKISGLNPQYTFKRFIVGDNNRLAYAVSTAIADAPGKVYNPFFLYSDVGMGKTHLVQAIGHQVLENHPNLKVLYRTGEQFLNDVVDALRKGSRANQNKRTSFKKKYRNVDVLIIDDVHSIAGRTTTQEEFFHTFNALYMSQKQIILTSDRAPYEIRTLEERLSSRFASGMIADIQVPDLDTRLAILKERNNEMNLGAPPEILEYIAQLVDTNVRELEAKLLQIVTKAKTEGKPLTKDLVSDTIGKMDKEKQKRISPNVIIKEVAKYYGITIRDIKGNRRLKTIVVPRQITMFMLRDMIEMGYQAIGEVLGGRDHSTILHGVNKIEKALKSNTALLKEIKQIKDNIVVNQQ